MSRAPCRTLLMLAMALPGAARALGLGDIRVDSELNEPLSAQIDIVGATRDELIALTATVANREVFQRYGADRPAFLSSATFKVGLDARGRPVLNVRSAESFTDPLVSLLVDLRWGKGELIREYPLLLDPPGLAPASRVADVAVVRAPTSSPKDSALMVAKTHDAKTSAAPATPAAADFPQTNGVHQRVNAGDTLRGIARRVGARSEPQLQRMMIAIFRANPHAFGGNVNRLHLGAVLGIPTTEDVAAVSNAEAKQAVREQMTAWRLEGRPAAPRRVAAAEGPADANVRVAAVAQQESPVVPETAALKGRVQTLEQELDDMHRQLANENAKIQDLKQLASQAAASPAEPLEPAAQSIKETTPVLAAVPPLPARSNSLLGPVAMVLALMAAGFAFLRRLLKADAAPTKPNAEVREAGASNVAKGSAPSDQPQITAKVEAPAPAAAEVPTSVRAALPAAPPRASTEETTVSLAIDTEALERSYLDSMGAEVGLDTVAIDASDLDAALLENDINTVIVDAKKLDTAAVDSELDYNLIDLDATAHHVQMPSALHDRAVMGERRTNIVDVLKAAIDRDPYRRDLRMKLLQTYYSAATTNQRAFLEVVRKLAREREYLSEDDWQEVMMMGREIASDDILFADQPKEGDDLAHCA